MIVDSDQEQERPPEAGRDSSARPLLVPPKQIPGRRWLPWGGGLARLCGAGRLFALIISDVPGDPLEMIASGPTVADSSTPADALAILERFGMRREIAPSIFDYLSAKGSGVGFRPGFFGVVCCWAENDSPTPNGRLDCMSAGGYDVVWAKSRH